MPRETQHQYRERGGTFGQEGITSRARGHYGVFNPDTGVCFKLYPDNTEGIRKAHENVANNTSGESPRRAAHIKFGVVMLYQPEGASEPKRVQHGINDGTEKLEHEDHQAKLYRTPMPRDNRNWID